MILQPAGRGTSINVLLGKFRWNKELIGTKDGVNITFTTPDVFVQSGEIVIRVYRNGQKLREGSSNDYTVSESGGPGTGFNTVVFQGPAPLPFEVLSADYNTP